MKVGVGISGGVDSAVTALLLLEQGYDVVGYTMTLGRAGEEASLADVRVTQNITDVASYNSYRTWAAGVTASGTATAADVKVSENAWLSYALNTTNLVETPSSEDVTVSSIAPAADGAFALEISVKDVAIGAGRVTEEQMQDNLAKVFGIEGAASLDAGTFSSTNVVYSLGQPVDGKVPVSVKPVRTGGAFFMRARLTP